MSDLTGEILAVANQFRLGRCLEASQVLPDLLSRLIKADGTNLMCPDQMAVIAELSGEILQCQTSHDWIGLADYLEYGLAKITNLTKSHIEFP